jgi:hypothetical protein
VNAERPPLAASRIREIKIHGLFELAELDGVLVVRRRHHTPPPRFGENYAVGRAIIFKEDAHRDGEASSGDVDRWAIRHEHILTLPVEGQAPAPFLTDPLRLANETTVIAIA